MKSCGMYATSIDKSLTFLQHVLPRTRLDCSYTDFEAVSASETSGNIYRLKEQHISLKT
jgi:hypothetical protein